jgi:hypothetical protein
VVEQLYAELCARGRMFPKSEAMCQIQACSRNLCTLAVLLPELTLLHSLLANLLQRMHRHAAGLSAHATA